MISEFITGGPETIAFKIQVVSLVIGFLWLNILALMVTFSDKYDVKEKLLTVGTPGSILFLSIMICLMANTHSKK